MRIVLDTNVFISAVFFGGVPGRILDAWRDGTVQLVLSAQILDEYQRVGRILAGDYPGVDLVPFLGLRLLPEGGTALLILGAHNTPSAVSREKGFREVVGNRLDVRVIEGKWQAERAEEALRDWLRFGAGRAREVDLVVSQNDSMALGVRRALQRHESEAGARGLAAVPIVGCDGVPDEGQAMVRRGELTATVVMPASSPRAVEMLDAFWQRGKVPDQDALVPTSFPPVEQLAPLRRRGGT